MPARLCLFPDPVLRKKTKSVRVFDKNLVHTIDLLDQTMRSHPHGIGIAAPQIGKSICVAIVNVSARIPEAARLVLVNPEILEKREERISREGCMSLPNYTGNLKRYDWVRTRWQDEGGVLHEKISTGIEAVCIQHEVDHLNGVLFLDHISSLKRDMIPRPRKRSKKNR